jgi:ATP-binding cassette subfamily B protein
MASSPVENAAPPRFHWRDLWVHGRFALHRAWAASPPLLGGLVMVEVLTALVPVLFALAAGLVLREAKYIFDGDPGHEGILALLLAGVVGLMLLETLATIARRYVTSRLIDEIRVHLSIDILKHLSSLDLAFFEDSASQDMAERAGHQPGRDLVDFLSAIMMVATQGFQAASLAVVLIYIEPLFTPLVILVSIPLLIFRWRMAQLTYATLRKQATIRRWSGYYSSALTTTPFLPTVKLYNLAPVLLRRYTEYLEGIVGVNRHLYRREALGGTAAATLVILAALGLVVWVGYRTASGEVSIQMLGTFVVAVNRIQASIQTFVDAAANALERVLFISNLGELFGRQPRIRSGPERPTQTRGSIELRDVHFVYPGSTAEVIKGVDMTLEAGKTIALVGPNGCGKTTLTRLIARLHDVNRGSILLDGNDIRALSLAHLQEQIAYVSQSPVRFEATVGENIAYGDWSRLADDPGEVRRIAEEAQIAEMIAGLSDGYDTLLGRRFGTFDLSVGQWQRLAVARALAKNASILILDEPTASMDAQSELDMYRGFQKLATGKTTLLISHRFSTVSMADYIYVMDEGQIVDHGVHAELLERGGMYAALYELHHRLSDLSGSAQGDR